MEYEFTKHADRELRKLPKDVQCRIIQKLKYFLAAENPLHFADSVEGKHGKVYRFRIGDYRVIFDWLGKRILVTKISPRPRAY